MEPPPSPWKKPCEVMQLHKLKKRKKALQDRMKQPSGSTSEKPNSQKSLDLDFSRVLEREKRVNPFSKNIAQQTKKPKLQSDTQLDESNDKTLFAILNLPARVPDKPPQDVNAEKLATFSNLLQKYTADHTVEAKPLQNTAKFLPIDWAIKTKVRIMSQKPFPWTTKLKASEEASGITGFVRCVAAAAGSLDTSPRAALHQACLYWQHPSLPWRPPLPPAGLPPAPPGLPGLPGLPEDIKRALFTEWSESFRSLFQLLRALHCPYFYVCADTFTCLFRAAGINGAAEPSALLAPTSRGLRRALRRQDVEFTMPLRPDNKCKLNTSDDDKARNSSHDSCYDTMDEWRSKDDDDDDDEVGDEEDPDQFLSQLGFETEVIKKINNAQARLTACADGGVDRAAASLVLARGADAHALFNFLLNCRSVAAAPAPPTLLAPVAFCGATLAALKVRASTVVCAGQLYHSLELRGPVLPSALHALCAALRRQHRATASLTLAQPPAQRALAAAARAAPEEVAGQPAGASGAAFTACNLSDCGLDAETLRHFCSAERSRLACLDSVKYSADDGTYRW